MELWSDEWVDSRGSGSVPFTPVRRQPVSPPAAPPRPPRPATGGGPGPAAQQPLQVSPRRDQRCLAVALLPAPPPEPARPVPVVRLGEEWCPPRLPFPERLLVGRRRVVAPPPPQVRRVKAAADAPAAGARGAPGPGGAAPARRRPRVVAPP